MAGYIGSKASVTQVDGYNRTEADAEFLNQTEGDARYVEVAGDTMTGNLLLPNLGVDTDDDTKFLRLSANATQATTGVAIQLWGKDMASWGGGIHYLADTRGVDGSHRFWTWDGSAFTNRVSIDEAGRVTMPYQPAFTAWNVGGNTVSGSFTLNTLILNNGGHYSTSTGRFTAPVTGMYFFSLTGFSETDAGIMADVEIRRNGAMVVRTYSNEPGGTYRPFATQAIIFLSAGDFVQPHSYANLHGNNNPVFSGHLIG